MCVELSVSFFFVVVYFTNTINTSNNVRNDLDIIHDRNKGVYKNKIEYVIDFLCNYYYYIIWSPSNNNGFELITYYIFWKILCFRSLIRFTILLFDRCTLFHKYILYNEWLIVNEWYLHNCYVLVFSIFNYFIVIIYVIRWLLSLLRPINKSLKQ